MSSGGNRTSMIVMAQKKYDTLERSFSSAIDEINSVLEDGFIVVDGKQIEIEMFLDGDYTFLVMVMGLSVPHLSIHACAHKLDRCGHIKAPRPLQFGTEEESASSHQVYAAPFSWNRNSLHYRAMKERKRKYEKRRYDF